MNLFQHSVGPYWLGLGSSTITLHNKPEKQEGMGVLLSKRKHQDQQVVQVQKTTTTIMQKIDEGNEEEEEILGLKTRTLRNGITTGQNSHEEYIVTLKKAIQHLPNTRSWIL
jgi:hypothetical protein